MDIKKMNLKFCQSKRPNHWRGLYYHYHDRRLPAAIAKLHNDPQAGRRLSGLLVGL